MAIRGSYEVALRKGVTTALLYFVKISLRDSYGTELRELRSNTLHTLSRDSQVLMEK